MKLQQICGTESKKWLEQTGYQEKAGYELNSFINVWASLQFSLDYFSKNFSKSESELSIKGIFERCSQ